MAFEMTLAGVALGPSFPVYGMSYEYIRPDDQGPSFKRCHITLTGFLEGSNFEAVMALYQILQTQVGTNDLVPFTLIDGDQTIHNSQMVYVSSYREPEDTEYAKHGVGDYSIELYYYADQTDNLGIICTYGDYTFLKTPKWGRQITPNRDHHRSPLRGSLATIGLSGFIFGTSHTDLMVKLGNLSAAFNEDRILRYGDFQQAVRVMSVRIEDAVMLNFAYYQINLAYDIGNLAYLSRKLTITRLHNNPVITDEPYCNRQLIELLGRSGQTITYSFSIESALSLQNARELLAVEATNVIEPGGIEMQGGQEQWDLERFQVNVTIIKFYPGGVVANLPGTG